MKKSSGRFCLLKELKRQRYQRVMIASKENGKNRGTFSDRGTQATGIFAPVSGGRRGLQNSF